MSEGSFGPELLLLIVYGDYPRLRLPIAAWTCGSGLGLIYGG
jgi:hypothetical protein